MIAYYTVMDRSSTRIRGRRRPALAASSRPRRRPGTPSPTTSRRCPVSRLPRWSAASADRRAYLPEAEARAEQAQAERDREVALRGAGADRIARELHDVVAHHVA